MSFDRFVDRLSRESRTRSPLSSCAALRTSRAVSTRVLPPAPRVREEYDYNLILSGDRPISVRLDVSGQHTISWWEPIEHTTLTRPESLGASDAKPEPLLGAGSCCLYTFPRVLFTKARRGAPNRPREPTIQQTALLIEILLQLARAPHDFMLRNDSVGATPILALLIANTDAALQASMAVFKKFPRTMLSVHGPVRPPRLQPPDLRCVPLCAGWLHRLLTQRPLEPHPRLM